MGHYENFDFENNMKYAFNDSHKVYVDVLVQIISINDLSIEEELLDSSISIQMVSKNYDPWDGKAETETKCLKLNGLVSSQSLYICLSSSIDMVNYRNGAISVYRGNQKIMMEYLKLWYHMIKFGYLGLSL